MISIEKVQKKVDYYKSALKSLHEYGGNAELVRGVARIALRKPSDIFRKVRWKAMSLGACVDSVILDFEKFKLMVDAHDEGIAAELALDHMHEPFGTEILLSILKDDMTVVELGANIGYYTMQESCQRKLKRIVAIEPNPVSFEVLSENVRMNECKHVDLFNVGISDVDGNLPFYISKHSNICSIGARDDYERKIDVPVLKLDTLVERENVDTVDMIRMDIEGHEICALRGMLETLKKNKPWICMEYHAPMISDEDREYFISTLESLDYELKCFTFRWSDYPIFGHNIVERKSIIKTGDLRNVLEAVTKQVLLLFIAPRSAEFEIPSL